jgi:hypothetical protein
MNLQAAVKGIAPAGGIRPASHITASPVSATKAEPAAHYLVPAILSIALGGPTGAIAAVIEGTTNRTVLAAHDAYGCVSDLSRSSTLSGQRSNTDERHIGRQRFGFSRRTVGATSRSGATEPTHAGVGGVNLGNPCAEKVRPHRPRQSSAPEGHRQGTLTITGSNVRLGTEMPVALSLFL